MLATPANSTIETFDAHVLQRIDDETAKFRLDVNIEDITNRMLGINPPIDE